MSSNAFASELLLRNNDYVNVYHQGPPTLKQVRETAVPIRAMIFTCMDPRVDPAAILQLKPGGKYILLILKTIKLLMRSVEAVIARNAGGDPSANILDLLAVDGMLKFQEIIVMHHTDCGKMQHTDHEIRGFLKQQAPGHEVEIDALEFGSFKDPHERGRQSVAYLKNHPLVRKELVQNVTALVFDTQTGVVSRVEA
ncbi:hypothetical protein F5Y19DRAFT_481130 [Xylariaceae sp. FL1651]|nr:hypothetical protein F5Y19DRAFT_481130 [Xylariaceae sp. FL1651]